MTDRLIRIREVTALTGKSRASVYRGMANGTFPPSVRIGQDAVAWPESAIARWIEERKAEAGYVSEAA